MTMAGPVPASLKSADIARFALRASQLEKVKPVVWYWCVYHIANLILEKGLHTADSESLAYTTQLMDELEQFKTQNATNDAVIDDVAGKAYIEQFGLDTFTRADNTVRVNKATRQTADTFQAAGTFLDLLAIWGPIEPETAAKAKYAKYHALRIAKALRAGEDPNQSNPKPQPDIEESLPQLDPNDAEVQALEGNSVQPRQPSVVDTVDDTDSIQSRLAGQSTLDRSLHPSRDQSVVRQQQQPSVVEVADEAESMHHSLAQQSSLDQSLHPSRAPSAPRSVGEAVSPLASHDASSFYTNSAQPDISPIDSPSTERKPSIGGNYFPVVPPTQSSQQDHLPAVPSDMMPTAPAPPSTSTDPPGPPIDTFLPSAPTAFTSQAQAPVTATLSPQNQASNFAGPFLPQPVPGHQPQISPGFISQSQFRQQLPQAQSQSQLQPTHQPLPPPTIASPPPAPRLTSSLPQQTYNSAPPTDTAPSQSTVVDEESIMKAQKHARWAISALNFEDVPTAIKELEGALRMLGAR